MAKGGPVEWLIAREAVALCGRLFDEVPLQAQLRLVRLAADDLVRTRCKHWISRIPMEETQRDTDCSIPPEFWDDFQERGQLVDWPNATFAAEGHYDPIWGVRKTTVHGVEFCSTDLQRYRQSTLGEEFSAKQAALGAQLAALSRKSPGNVFWDTAFSEEEPEATEPQSVSRPSKRVSAPEFDQWFDSSPPEVQRLGYMKLWAKSQEHFEGRWVARKLAEDKARGRQTGRPKSTSG